MLFAFGMGHRQRWPRLGLEPLMQLLGPQVQLSLRWLLRRNKTNRAAVKSGKAEQRAKRPTRRVNQDLD